jgi:hypothetical protein
VYQLLLCSIKGPKRAILQGIIDHHAWLHKTHSKSDASASGGTDEVDDDDTVTSTQHFVSGDRLRPMEGTVILHVTFAIQQDHELGKELLKIVKQTDKLTPFALALALSLMRTHRYEDLLLDTLKVSIVFVVVWFFLHSLPNVCEPQTRVVLAFRQQEQFDSSVWLSSYFNVASQIERTFLVCCCGLFFVLAVPQKYECAGCRALQLLWMGPCCTRVDGSGIDTARQLFA